MKGIILAGGKATRLYPITRGVCKQLLPVYDKPMIYYPLSVLMLAGIKDILIISTPDAIDSFEKIFGNGEELGLNISYAIQPEPRGIAQAFLIAENFIAKDTVALILGDNIFFGNSLSGLLKKARLHKKGGTIFAYNVSDPQRYGVITFDKKLKVTSIIEKPKHPKSNYAVTGLYFCDNRVVGIAKKLKPSKRGELEITDILKNYLKHNQLKVELLGRGYAWLDTGTYDSLIDASSFIKTVEDRQGLKIGCVEEIAYHMGFITAKDLLKISSGIKTKYGDYLRKIVEDE